MFRTKRMILWIILLALILLTVPFCALAAETAIMPLPAIAAVDRNSQYPQIDMQPVLHAGTGSQEPAVYYTTIADAAAFLREKMVDRESSITLGFQTATESDLYAEQILDAAFGHTGVPDEGDYLHWHYVGCQMLTGGYIKGGVYYYSITYAPTYFTTAEQETQVDSKVAQILKDLDVYTASEYTKVRAVYDYICENVTYDTAGLEAGDTDVYTAYAAAIDGSAVCQGYASLLYRMTLELGVDCRVVAGWGNGDRHGWNIVRIRGLYYDADSTWDAGYSEYNYFLHHEADFPDHIRDEEYSQTDFQTAYPMATANYTPNPDCTGSHVFGSYVPNGDNTETAVCNNCEVTHTRPAGSTETVKNGWVSEGKTWYYYKNGNVITGWQKIGNIWYYFKGDGVMITGWQKISNVWYYFKGDGAMVTGWLKLGSTWYYFKNDGAMVTGTVTIGGKVNKFDSSGAWLGEVAQNGWIAEGNKWYYYQSGKAVTGWKSIGGVYYYFNTSGIMQTGWVSSSGVWYYMNSSGAMVTGWQKVGGTWYYFKSSGAMATGWLKLGGTWYYFKGDGAMVTGSVKIGGKTYRFNSSGACLNP